MFIDDIATIAELIYQEPIQQLRDTSINFFRVAEENWSGKSDKDDYRNIYIVGKFANPNLQTKFTDIANGGKAPKKGKWKNLLTSWEEVQDWLYEQREVGGIPFAVFNGRNQGTKAADITHGNIIHIENDDGADIETKKNEWKTFGLPKPSFQITTGNKSVHHYYVFNADYKGIPMEQLYEVKAQLVRRFGFDGYADGHIEGFNKFKSQTYRLPGFAHRKSGKAGELIHVV